MPNPDPTPDRSETLASLGRGAAAAPLLASTRTGMLLVFFALGFCSVIVQTTLIREALVVFAGNELCLGVVFGVWLFWIGVGAAIGSRLSRWVGPFWPFLILVVLGALSPAAQIYGLRIVRQLFAVEPGTYVSFGQMALASLVSLAPFSFIVGITFPLGCKIFAGEQTEDALSIGWLYVTEAVGFLTGGLVFTFFLVEHYQAFLNVTVVMTVLLAACFSLSVRALRGIAQLAVAGLLAAMILAAFSSVHRLYNLDRTSIEKRWLSIVGTSAREKIRQGAGVGGADAGEKNAAAAIQPRLTLHSYTESKYQNLALGREEGQYSVYGDGALLFSFPDEYAFPQQANLILSEHPAPLRLLIIGNATQGLLKEFLRNPLKDVWQVDLDPKVTQLLNPPPGVKGIVYPDPKAPREVLPPDDLKALSDPRMHFVYTDGRFFVKTTKERFDVVFVNLPPPSTAMLNRYYTREFFQEAQRILNPGGVVALTIPSAANYIGDIVGNEGGSIFHTVRDVFARQTPEAKRYVALSGGDTAYLFACDTPDVVTMDPSVLAKRFTARKVEVPLFSPELFPQTIMQSRIDLAWDSFMSRKDVPRNTDLRPVTYYYNLRRWDAAAGSKLQPVFNVVGRFNIVLLIALAAGLLALRFGYVLLPQRHQRVCEVVTACAVGVLLLGAAYWMLYAAEHPIAAAVAAVFIILFCLMWVVAAIRRLRTATCAAQFNYLAIITVCGFSSMAFELILIFAFQNLYGFLYYQIGLIIALFMVGLAMGGLVSNLLVRKERAGVRTLMGVELAMAAYGCLLPPALTMFSTRVMVHMPIVFSQAIFMSFILLAGALGGFVFPLVTGLYFKIVASTGMTAGKVDSADHVGACVGSLMAGTVLVPIIGIGASSIFVAFLNLACAFLLVVQAGKKGSGTEEVKGQRSETAK